MPDQVTDDDGDDGPEYLDPAEVDIVYGDRRISRPDSQLPDWYMPDGAYRPIPIVWFAAALMAQCWGLLFTIRIFGSFPGWIVMALGALLSFTIGALTWQRGMKATGMGWKIATIVMLVVTFALSFAGSATRL